MVIGRKKPQGPNFHSANIFRLRKRRRFRPEQLGSSAATHWGGGSRQEVSTPEDPYSPICRHACLLPILRRHPWRNRLVRGWPRPVLDVVAQIWMGCLRASIDATVPVSVPVRGSLIRETSVCLGDICVSHPRGTCASPETATTQFETHKTRTITDSSAKSSAGLYGRYRRRG